MNQTKRRGKRLGLVFLLSILGVGSSGCMGSAAYLGKMYYDAARWSGGSRMLAGPALLASACLNRKYLRTTHGGSRRFEEIRPSPGSDGRNSWFRDERASVSPSAASEDLPAFGDHSL